MEKISYRFCDGVVSEIEVDEELYGVLEAMDKFEKNNNRKETRRHTSLDNLIEHDKKHGACKNGWEAQALYWKRQSGTLSSDDCDPLEIIIAKEQNQKKRDGKKGNKKGVPKRVRERILPLRFEIWECLNLK